MSLDVNTSSLTLNEVPSPTTATPAQPPARMPRWQKVTSALGLGPAPFTKVIAVFTLIEEGNRSRGSTESGALSLQEENVRRSAIRSGQKIIDKAVQGPIAKRVRILKAQQAEINMNDRARVAYKALPVLGPTGERLSEKKTRKAHNKLRTKVHKALVEGSKEHLLRAQSKKKETALLLLDFPLFLWAMISALNVNVALVGHEVEPTLRMVVAVIFSAMATLLLAVITRSMGARHRVFKNSDGTITAPGSSRRIVILEVVALALTIASAVTVMGTRVYIEAAEAGVNGVLSVSLACLFGGLIAWSAYVNWLGSYLAGSTSTDDLQQYSYALRSRDHHRHNLTTERQLKVEQAGVVLAELQRIISDVRIAATKHVELSAADAAIRLARSYRSPDHRQPLPSPGLDDTALKLAKKQAKKLAAHHKFLMKRASPSSPDPSIEEELITLLEEEEMDE